MPETRYAPTPDGSSIAYQRVGDAGPDLVWVTGTASHVELFWEIPGWAHVVRRIAAFSRFVWFDKRGTGLSDRNVGGVSIETRVDDIRAVMDAAGIERAILVGASEGGAMAALFAATYPERVERLVAVASWAVPDQIGADAFAQAIEDRWGTGEVFGAIWARGLRDTEMLARVERAMGTPGSMAAAIRAAASFDARSALPFVQAPTLVVHCSDDPIIPIAAGRALASRIPGSTFVELDGAFHGSARPEDMDRYCDVIEEFLLGSVGSSGRSERVLATVLFTDIVESTEQAVARGDRRWAELLDAHDHICRRSVEQERGTVVKHTGDGVLATFAGPAAAVRAAHAMVDHLDVLGLAIRAGVHTGEVERRGDDIGGLGVHLAARIMAAAVPGEVWVSSTVPGLAAGSGIRFEDRGSRPLKGIDGEQQLLAAMLP
jgi:class 3 adenylate cyclase/predicted esterase